MIRVLSLLFVVIGLGGSLPAQDRPNMSWQCMQCELADVLSHLEEVFELSFAYESSLVSDKHVNVDLRDEALISVLDKILADTDIAYQIINDSYIVLNQVQTDLDEAPLVKQIEACGTIVDGLLQEPLVGAYISVANGSTGTQTDLDGKFNLVFDDQATATVSYLGYKSQEIPLSALASPTCPTIELELDIQTMPIAVISEFTVDMLKPEPSKNRYRFEPLDIPTLPGWGEPDLLRSLQLLPGISSPDGTASNLQIRGSNSDQNLILWDGITIYQSGHFFGQYSAFNPYLIESVNVYRGGFDADFGGRLAGVIDINSTAKLDAEPRFGFGANLVSAHALAELPLVANKLSLTLGYRRSFADLFPSGTYRKLFDVVFQNSRLTDNESEVANLGIEDSQVRTDFYFQDLNARLNWEIDEDNRFGFSAYSGQDRFNYDFEVLNLGSEDELDIGNWGLSSWYERDWSEKSRSWVRLAYSNFRRNYQLSYSFDINTDPDANTIAQDNAIGDLNLSWRHEWDLGSKHQLRIGGQLLTQQLDFSYAQQNAQDEQSFTGFDFTAKTEAWHATYIWKPSEQWDFSFGLRRVGFLSQLADTIPLLSDNSWQPRWRMLWRDKKLPLTIKLAGGWYRQFLYQVPLALDELSSDDELWVMASNYFPSLRSRDWQIEVALHAGNFYLSAEYFSKFINNISARDFSVAFDPDDPLRFRGTAQAQGVDVLIKYRYRSYRSWLAYSLTQVDQTFEANGQTIVLPPDFDQRHRLNFTHMLSLPKWEFSLNWQYSSGRPFTQPIGINAQEINNEIRYFLRYDLPNQDRLPANHRLDIAANYKFKQPGWQGKLGLSVYNVYNQYNAFDYDHYILPPDEEMNRNDPEIVRLERRMLGFTPNLFLQLEW
ncbi:MAG: TonB-dependent receptor plug domain-containing protein [Bacteroidota bacterium]